MITTRSRFFASSSGSAEMPSSSGISMSRITTSGLIRSIWSTASRPLRSEPASASPGSSSIQRDTRPRTTTESSTTRTRIAESAVATADGAAETARPIYATRTQTLSTALNTSHTGERRPPRVESPEPPRRAPSDQPNLLGLRLDDVLVERLHDVFVGPGMQRARDVGDVVLGGAEHDLRAVAARHPPQRPQELVAVHLRHVPVEQD